MVITERKRDLINNTIVWVVFQSLSQVVIIGFVYLLYPVYAIALTAMGILTGAAIGRHFENKLLKTIEEKGENDISAYPSLAIAGILLMIGLMLVVPAILQLAFSVVIWGDAPIAILLQRIVSLAFVFLFPLLLASDVTRIRLIGRWEKKNQKLILRYAKRSKIIIYSAPLPCQNHNNAGVLSTGC